MLRRSVLFAILVIILVSLNWFKSLLAQDLSSLSEEQKQQLLQKYRSNQPAKEDQKVYVSPDFRPDDHPSETIGLYPADSAQALSAHREALTTNEVTAATGKSPLDGLRPFGLELFEGGADVVSPPDIASAENYILGPGDNIIVYLWGRVDREYRLALDREGKVFIPRAGEIIGWGLSLKQFTDRVRTRVSKVYSQFDLTVSLGKIRSIRIYVTGEVRRPGAYTVSSLTSLFNAIYLAGGPNERGSMRRIKLMRNGTCIETVDLYRFLLEGDNSTDVRLRTGDALFIPVAASRVAVAGEVRRPALYELLGTESALDVLTLAGGPTAEAHLERAMLERISSESEWEVLDLNLKTGDSAGAGTLTLQDGDRLTVYSIFEQRKHMVAVFGHVQHSGYYERNDSTRVSDLIERGKLRSYDVYLERADLFRRHVDDRVEVIPVSLQAISDGDRGADFVLRDRDSLHIYSINEVKWDRHVYIEGEVRQPGEYPLYEQMTVADLIFLSGSYTRSANRLQAEIARLDSDGEVTLLYLELNDSASLLMPLVEDDHLFIRRIPLWKSDRVVSLTGEIMYPGSYTLSST
ncbi:MAG: SLBB domain-containing protein, partial [Candidatus Zixiibacteriota bacterium]